MRRWQKKTCTVQAKRVSLQSKIPNCLPITGQMGLRTLTRAQGVMALRPFLFDMTNELTITEQNELERCEVAIKQGLETFLEVGQALMTIRDKRLYRLQFRTFEDYCRERWGMSRIHAHRMIEASEVVSNVLPIGNIPRTESQARPLTKLEPELQQKAWEQVVQESPDKITAKRVEEVVEQWKPYNEEVKAAKQAPDLLNPAPKCVEDVLDDITNRKKAHVSNNSGNNEWYTPKCYLDSARLVMGSMDLDPASSAIANEIVQAAKFFTAEDNGLEQDWRGNIWMNPPYAQPLIQQFCAKLETEDYTQAIVLVNNATETKWGNALLTLASAVCFPKGRIKFVDPDGNLGDSPLQGQMIAYIGLDKQRFCKEFKKYGPCLEA